MNPSSDLAISRKIIESSLIHPTTREKLEFAEYRDPISKKTFGVSPRSADGGGISIGYQRSSENEDHRTHNFDGNGKYLGSTKGPGFSAEARQLITALNDSSNFLSGRVATNPGSPKEQNVFLFVLPNPTALPDEFKTLVDSVLASAQKDPQNRTFLIEAYGRSWPEEFAKFDRVFEYQGINVTPINLKYVLLRTKDSKLVTLRLDGGGNNEINGLFGATTVGLEDLKQGRFGRVCNLAIDVVSGPQLLPDALPDHFCKLRNPYPQWDQKGPIRHFADVDQLVNVQLHNQGLKPKDRVIVGLLIGKKWSFYDCGAFGHMSLERETTILTQEAMRTLFRKYASGGALEIEWFAHKPEN